MLSWWDWMLSHEVGVAAKWKLSLIRIFLIFFVFLTYPHAGLRVRVPWLFLDKIYFLKTSRSCSWTAKFCIEKEMFGARVCIKTRRVYFQTRAWLRWPSWRITCLYPVNTQQCWPNAFLVPTSKALGRRCINAIQIFCVYWMESGSIALRIVYRPKI